MPHILLTNDDGYQAAGLARAGGGARRIRDGEHCCAEPGAERSGAIADAAAADRLQPDWRTRMGDGWDAGGLRDRGAAQTFAGKTGHGDFRDQSRSESGENVYYSGTVGAAREGGVASHAGGSDVAVLEKDGSAIWKVGAVGAALAEMILKEGLPDQVLLNVNVPEPWNGGVRFTRQSKKITRNQLTEGKDPRGRSYFWLLRTANRQGYGAGHGLRRDFFRRRFHHAIASRPHAHRIAQSSFPLGRADRGGFYAIAIWSAVARFPLFRLHRRHEPDRPAKWLQLQKLQLGCRTPVAPASEGGRYVKQRRKGGSNDRG